VEEKNYLEVAIAVPNRGSDWRLRQVVYHRVFVEALRCPLTSRVGWTCNPSAGLVSFAREGADGLGPFLLLHSLDMVALPSWIAAGAGAQ
jgi:hypothetical protein